MNKPGPAAAAVMKNAATAPFVYFDGAPAMGMQNGLVEIELAARAVLPHADGTVTCDMVCVAHLRCSATAAANLRDALTRSLDMLETPPPTARN